MKTKDLIKLLENDGWELKRHGNDESLPNPTTISKVKTDSTADIVTLVDVDFAEYRRKNNKRTVKKNCTIPSWLNFEAEKAGVNFSAILTAALKSELNIQSR